MPALSVTQCYAHAERLRGRTVLITGAGSGFGRATAIQFAKHGARLVLGDVDQNGLAQTCSAVASVYGKGACVSLKCDVTKWDEQVALFELGIKTFGSVDVVLPNAGITEVNHFDPVRDNPHRLTKPNLKTIDIDLVGVLYTTRIALWHFQKTYSNGNGLRAIVFTGSMSTFYGSDGVGYGVSKAGILGLQKGIEALCRELNIRVGTVCPYFSKTNIITSDFVHPHPHLGYAEVEDVVAAFVSAITDPTPQTNFGCYLIPDKFGVFRMESTSQFIGAEGARRGRGELKALLAQGDSKAKL